MHPSVNGRIALIRDLAVNRPAAISFDRELIWTRVLIAGVLAAGVLMEVILLKLPPHPQQTPIDATPTAQRAGF
jgi:hypothetical protein